MLTDLSKEKFNNNLIYDFCIVGAGIAGITLSLNLEKMGYKILLIESGEFIIDGNTQSLYEGFIKNDLPSVPLDASRLRFFGGTSNHWTGHCGVFDEEDFLKRSSLAYSGWPFLKKDLLPFYKDAYKIFELEDYNKNFEKKFDLYFPSKSNEIKNEYLERKAIRFSDKYKNDLIKSNNIMVCINTNLYKINFNNDFSMVSELQFRSLNNNKFSIKPQYSTILACGGVENARLLLNSKLNGKLDNIGKFFSFHPRILSGNLIYNKESRLNKNYYEWFLHKQHEFKFFIKLKPEINKSQNFLNHALNLERVSDDTSESYKSLSRIKNDILNKKIDKSFFSDLKNMVLDIDNLILDIKNNRFSDDVFFDIYTWLEQSPCKESVVELTDKECELGQKKVRIRWNYNKKDIQNVYEYNKRAALNINQDLNAKMFVNSDILEPDNFEKSIRLNSGGGHQIGTTRMSIDKNFGVTDQNGKIYGLNNLYCAGSSLFPTTSWVNPSLTIAALSIRLSKHLKKIYN